MVDQLVLEGCDFSADVPLRHCLDEERPVLDAETVHSPLGLILLTEEQSQFAQPVQVDVGSAGLLRGFDADGEKRRRWGQCVRPQVDDDGPCGVKPLQEALGAAEIHLFNIPSVSLMGQPTTRKQKRDISSVPEPMLRYKEEFQLKLNLICRYNETLYICSNPQITNLRCYNEINNVIL